MGRVGAAAIRSGSGEGRERLRLTASRLSRDPVARSLAAGLFLCVLTLVLHGSALRGGWRADDGDHLRFALSHQPWEYFFVPAVNRAHHGATITPWNVLFYDVNLRVFGFAPAGHYLHMLGLVAGAACLLYAVLRQFLARPASLVGASALLLAGPTTHIAQYLMVGHYATGLVFCLAAIYGWIRYVRGGRTVWLGIGAVSYLLATLCKEVCVPLVVLLPFLDVGSVGRRLRALVPFVGIALGYAAWRRVVLGVFLGGASPTGEGFDPVRTLRLLARIPYLLLGEGPTGLLGALLLAAALLLVWREGRVRLPPSLALGTAVCLPLVPLTIVPGILSVDRYLYFPAAALAAGIAAVWPRGGAPRWRAVPALCLLAALGIGHRQQERATRGELRRMDALYGFALGADRRTQGLFVEGDSGYLMGVLSAVGAARDLFEGRPPEEGLVVLTDTPAALPVLSRGVWSSRTFFHYAGGEVRPMSPVDLSAAVAAQFAALRRGQQREIRVQLTHASGTLRWEFGPWDGEYQVQLFDGSVTLARKGAYPWPSDKRIELSVCYQGRDGWVACSPRFGFDPRERSLVWSGTGVAPEFQPMKTAP